jgi:hypothetical protein
MNKLYSIVVAFLMFFNLSLFAQDGPPWDFNGTDHGFVAQNYASLTVGDTYVTFTLTDADADGDAESPNSNFRNLDAGIDTSSGSFIAITMKNETANNKMQAILGAPGAGCGCYVNFETLSANDADFVTHYINVGANSNWTGTLSEIIFRFKKGNGVNNQTFAGDILIDHIEIVESIPATPRVNYTFDDTSDSEGFSGVNGITLTQPVAGELHLDIAAQSPYPKLEQTGLYSVDADTYKYAQVTLVNNSPKNKLTLVSPSGGNEYSTRDMVANDGVVQTYELDLTALTNWNGTQANWWLQLVENPGDGPVASAGIIDIQQILFATESIMPPELACDESFSHTYGNNESGTLFSASNPGGEVTVTVTGQTETNYDFLIITDGAGNVLYNASGDHTGQAITSTDGTIYVEIDSDTTVSGYTLDFAVTCPASEDGMMELQGIIDFTVPSGGSDGKAIHVLVTADIADLSNYGIGVANNGGGTDGEEYFFPEGSATAGQHILVARSLEAMEAYGMTGFDQVLEASSDISQNGDDAIELYFGGGVIEVFGDVDVDGTGEAWEYMDSWAYKVEGAWTYGEVNCTDGSETTCDSGCPYPFVECSAGPCPAPDITSWTMTGDGAIFDGNNQDGVIGYQIEYSTSTFTPGDGTATVYEFDSFPHTMTGLESNTTYYFTIRSVCGDNNYSDWSDNGNDGPDAWTTTTCPSSYPLPYLNDFNDPVAWTTCQTFYDNDGDGNYWFYTTIDNSDNLTASSFSWNGSAFTPDNWVIMGPIDLTNVSDALLEWEVQALDPAYCNENYSVYVGPSNNYSDLLGSSVSYTETLESGGDACGSWANRSLDISAATGDLVYIGLRHHDVTDVYILSIDNVSVTSSTMSNEDFTLQNIDYSFDQETNLLRVTSEEILSNIQIYNMLGQEVLNQDLNDNSALLNLSSLSSSIYIVNVEGNNSKTKTFKLAIK